MHIALVTETYPPEINGVSLTLQSLVERLPEIGHEIQLIRPRQNRLGCGAQPYETLVRGVPLPRYPGLRLGWTSTNAMESLWRRSTPGAVYVATEGPLGWAALNAANSLDIPIATGFHTRFDDFAAHYGLRALAPLVLRYLRRFHNAADVNLVPTAALRHHLRSQGFQRVEVLARGVETTQFHPAQRDPELRRRWGMGQDEIVALYVGRIAPEKNLELALRAFEALKQRVPGARMVWVGEGPSLERWRRAHPDLIYSGMRLGQDLARHFASADLFLFPSRTETFGNVTLEALASGVPVVAFDYGAAEAHVISGVNGRTVAFGDEAGFIAASIALAEDLSSDPHSRSRYRLSCRASVAGLSHHAVARDLAALLGRLAERRWEAA